MLYGLNRWAAPIRSDGIGTGKQAITVELRGQMALDIAKAQTPLGLRYIEGHRFLRYLNSWYHKVASVLRLLKLMIPVLRPSSPTPWVINGARKSIPFGAATVESPGPQ